MVAVSGCGSVAAVDSFSVAAGVGQGAAYGAERFAREYKFACAAGALLQVGDMLSLLRAAARFAGAWRRRALVDFGATCLLSSPGVNFGAANDVRAYADA